MHINDLDEVFFEKEVENPRGIGYLEVSDIMKVIDKEIKVTVLLIIQVRLIMENGTSELVSIHGFIFLKFRLI